MKRLEVLASCLALCTLTAISVSACRPASYEIIPGKKNKKVDDTGSPQTFAPDSENPADKPDGPDQNPNGDNNGQNYLPTARIEVILGSKSVSKIKVGAAVRIQPSYDTVDPDDVGISVCRNPGIVQADYNIASEGDKSADRPSGCESLHVNHTFTKTGEYLIAMTVTSNENETATATMTLTVLPASADDFDRGGFTIAADPMITMPNEPITFTGHCETDTKNSITWAYGDNEVETEETDEGRTVTHAYANEGQYEVDALCVDEDGNERDAQVTIVVIDRDISPPGSPTPGTPDPADPDPNTGIDPDTGGTDPTPDLPNQGDPDQNTPDQDRRFPTQN